MHPGEFREGTGSDTGCGRHHPQHSPACTDVFRTNVYRRDSSVCQWDAVVEVSLFSYSIFARLLSRKFLKKIAALRIMTQKNTCIQPTTQEILEVTSLS